MSTVLAPGDPAPWFHAAALSGNPRYSFETAGGRPVLMLFHGSGAGPRSLAALALVQAHRALFDDRHASFFGVSVDPGDVEHGRIAQQLPGVRWLLDFDGAVSRQFGALDDRDAGTAHAPRWVLLDAMLRVVSLFPIDDGAAAFRALQALIATGADAPVPVLVVPRIIEPALCRELIALYEADGGSRSGFMMDEGGVTVRKFADQHKRRADYKIVDREILQQLKQRIMRALRPAILQAFQFDATRIERWLVCCYNGDGGGGHFKAHRDNTTRGTAHRKFAVTINLNADEYEGGDLRFPEFGRRSYRAPTGGAIVFSCSLLHEVLPVTRGKRYAFLPFLYDDAGARLRERNLAHVEPELQQYRSGLPPEERSAPEGQA
jgi:predicted 2-oxoglutarate/Fe(II)-dependent dioxygenase YbiX/peroxiredoxin